jgi:hypothetical protein
MGLKNSGPFFKRGVANKVLAGYVKRICTGKASWKEGNSQPCKDKTRSQGVWIAQVPHSPKRIVFKSLTFHCQKVRRHFCSSLDWRTSSAATMSRIWLRWFSSFESWWTWRSSVYGFWSFLTSKKIKFDAKNQSSVILFAEAFYMPLDAILPLFDGWRRYIYQILLKKAFVDHEIGYF